MHYNIVFFTRLIETLCPTFISILIFGTDNENGNLLDNHFVMNVRGGWQYEQQKTAQIRLAWVKLDCPCRFVVVGVVTVPLY